MINGYRRFVLLAFSLFILLAVPSVAEDKVSPAADNLKINVLWDRAQGWPSMSPTGDFPALIQKLKDLGASISELGKGSMYSQSVLSNIDLVIICDRSLMLYEDEQIALSNYILSGGSLLVICQSNRTHTGINSVLNNFGLMVTNTSVASEYLNVFNHPATTDRRKVSFCNVEWPTRIITSNGALAIGGRTTYTPSPSALISECYIALGGNTGKGRIIVAGDYSIWASNS
jgi:hypothetical protein